MQNHKLKQTSTISIKQVIVLHLIAVPPHFRCPKREQLLKSEKIFGKPAENRGFRPEDLLLFFLKFTLMIVKFGGSSDWKLFFFEITAKLEEVCGPPPKWG